MPIVVLGLSGHCNSYQTIVAVICNSCTSVVIVVIEIVIKLARIIATEVVV